MHTQAFFFKSTLETVFYVSLESLVGTSFEFARHSRESSLSFVIHRVACRDPAEFGALKAYCDKPPKFFVSKHCFTLYFAGFVCEFVLSWPQ